MNPLFKLLEQKTLFSFKGTEFTISPLFPLIILFFFWGFFTSAMWPAFLGGAFSLTALLIAHELGHMILAKAFKARVNSVNLHWFGGSCNYTGRLSPGQSALIAAGGVLAQSVLLAIAIALSFTSFGLLSPFMAVLIQTWIRTNLIFIVWNLVPIAPLDGATIFGYLKDKLMSK